MYRPFQLLDGVTLGLQTICFELQLVPAQFVNLFLGPKSHGGFVSKKSRDHHQRFWGCARTPQNSLDSYRKTESSETSMPRLVPFWCAMGQQHMLTFCFCARVKVKVCTTRHRFARYQISTTKHTRALRWVQ
jgi:hypothetical protein